MADSWIKYAKYFFLPSNLTEIALLNVIQVTAQKSSLQSNRLAINLPCSYPSVCPTELLLPFIIYSNVIHILCANLLIWFEQVFPQLPFYCIGPNVFLIYHLVAYKEAPNQKL